MLEVCKWGSNVCKTKNGDQLEEVECFKYLRSLVAADGGCGSDVVHKMNQGFTA